MPVSLQNEPDDLLVLRISGVLGQSEFDNTQSTVAGRVDAGKEPRVLIILENFEGWEPGSEWNSDYLFAQGSKIAKIAIVGEPHWELKALTFTGAGLRRTPVRYYPTAELAQARTWLADLPANS
jgi:hypothetical protein